MTTPFLGLRTTIYTVPSLEEAKNWYSQVFATQPYFESENYLGFDIAGYELGLLLESEAKIKSESKKTDNVLSHWGVDSIVDSYQRLLELGAKPHEEPTNVGGDIVMASVFDPWDNVIGLIFNPEFKPSS